MIFSGTGLTAGWANPTVRERKGHHPSNNPDKCGKPERHKGNLALASVTMHALITYEVLALFQAHNPHELLFHSLNEVPKPRGVKWPTRDHTTSKRQRVWIQSRWSCSTIHMLSHMLCTSLNYLPT